MNKIVFGAVGIAVLAGLLCNYYDMNPESFQSLLLEIIRDFFTNEATSQPSNILVAP